MQARIPRAVVAILFVVASGCNGTVIGPAPAPTATPPPGTLFVANCAQNSTSSLEQFTAATANGNIAPNSTLSGAATTMVCPSAVARDSANLYVSDISTNSVLVFTAGASGNTAPSRTISGSNTGLTFAEAIGLDSAGNIYVVNRGGIGSVTVYSAGASGNVAPTRTITGSNTVWSGITSITVGSAGDFYTAGVGNNHVLYFAAGANGNVAPTRDITGAATGLNQPWGVALDSSNNIYVLNNGGGGAITVYPAASTGNAAPSRTISGASTTLTTSNQDGIALDSAGNIYVTECPTVGTQQVVVFAAGANGNVAPARTIAGSATGLNCPTIPTVN